MSFALKPIAKEIQRELNRRAKALSRDSSAISGESESQNNISNELRTLNSRTTWMRWISGDDKPAVILGGLALTDDTGTEPLVYRLAKGFDEVYVPPNTPTVNRFAHQEADNSGIFSPRYRPVAGVKSVTTGFEGATKSVKKITVEWTVFDLDELDVLTPHFLWPGKWCMLEFGWNFEGMTPIGFYGTKLIANTKGDKLTNEFNSLEDQIYANKGNYECVTGVISNFEYTLRDDGGFDCTTTMTTHGISLLDATIDSPPYPVEAMLTGKATTTESEKAKQKKSSDKFKEIFSKLAEYFRTEVSKIESPYFYKPDSNKELQYLPKPPGLSTRNAPIGYKFYGDPVNFNFFLRVEGKRDQDNRKSVSYLFDKSLETDQSTWVRWGWIEDNVISKYLGFASYEEGVGGVPGDFKETKLQFRSIEDVLQFDATGAPAAPILNPSGDGISTKESVRIISHKHLLTTDINKFILVGKTPTLWTANSINASPEQRAMGIFLDQNIAELHNFEVPHVGDPTKREGYLRNVYFNVEWLNTKIQAARTLRQAIDNIWNEFNTEYQQYWDFKIIGNDQDLITVKLVDNNNPRYNVSDFNESNIENNIFSCYKFPTWTNESIVKNMEYSVTIPSSQTAVAALSGGDIQVDQPADRHKGDIGVQQYQKFLQKSFTKNKNKYFENTDRIVNRDNSRTYGLNSANPNEKLEVGKGNDMFKIMVGRGSIFDYTLPNRTLIHDAAKAKDDESGAIEIKPSIYFTKGAAKSGALYKGGKLVSNYAEVEDPKKTMWELLHSTPGSAKTQLFDLLNGISEIKLTIDGIAGIFPGDAFTSDHLPTHLLKKDTENKFPLVFQTTNVEQELTSNGWNTTISGMPRLNHNRIYEKQEVDIPPGKEIVGDDFQQFLDTKNILGMGSAYVTRMKMHVGIFLPLMNDKYFYTKITSVEGKAPDGTIVDPRYEKMKYVTGPDNNIGGMTKYLFPPENTKDVVLARSLPFASARKKVAKIIENMPSVNALEPADKIFGWFTDASGGEYEQGGSMNQGPPPHPDWHFDTKVRLPRAEYKYAKNPIATFGPDVKVEEALWFSMYNGILFAIPPLKCRDKNIPGELGNLSEDGTFKNMSYHLFKGLKKSKWDIKRKILTTEGQCDYTEEYLAEFKKFGGYAPCAFNSNPRDRDLFTYTQYTPPMAGGWKVRLDMTGWSTLNDKNLNPWLLQLTDNGAKEFRKFFTQMYKEFAYGPLLQLQPDQIETIKKRNIFGDAALATIFGEHGGTGKGINQWVTDEINDFVTEMQKTGILILPSALYQYSDTFGYGRNAAFFAKVSQIFTAGPNDIGNQELFFKKITNTAEKYTKLYYADHVAFMTKYMDFYPDRGFDKKYGKDGPGPNYPLKEHWNRGPFFYTETALGSKEVGKPPLAQTESSTGGVKG